MQSFEHVKVLPTEGDKVSFGIEAKCGEVHVTKINTKSTRFLGKVKLIKENENYGFVICEVGNG